MPFTFRSLLYLEFIFVYESSQGFNFLSFPYRFFSSFLFFSFLFRVIPVAYGSSQARGQIRAAAASLHHNQGNARSEPHLRPPPQLLATLDPLTHWMRPGTEPHGYWSASSPLSHNRNSLTSFLVILSPLILSCSLWRYFHLCGGQVCSDVSILLAHHFILAMAQRLNYNYHVISLLISRRPVPHNCLGFSWPFISTCEF